MGVRGIPEGQLQDHDYYRDMIGWLLTGCFRYCLAREWEESSWNCNLAGLILFGTDED